jgi:hypothetical protein
MSGVRTSANTSPLVRHTTVGAPLARAEGVIAFEVLLERLPNWTIADDLGGVAFARSYSLRGQPALAPLVTPSSGDIVEFIRAICDGTPMRRRAGHRRFRVRARSDARIGDRPQGTAAPAIGRRSPRPSGSSRRSEAGGRRRRRQNERIDDLLRGRAP